jgi:hypothetical protein
MRRAGSFAICLAAGALLSRVASADAEPHRIHGVVQTFDGNYLTIKADSGKTLLVGIQPQTRIVHSRMMALADLKSGDYVATLAMPDAKGFLHAQSVRVFANALLAAGEGQYKLDSNPLRIVTNGTVNAVSSSESKLSLTFHGVSSDGTAPCAGHAPPGGWGCTGNADLLIARGVPIIAITNGDTSLLRPGAIVSVTATSDAASLLTASGVSVERDAKSAQ